MKKPSKEVLEQIKKAYDYLNQKGQWGMDDLKNWTKESLKAINKETGKLDMVKFYKAWANPTPLETDKKEWTEIIDDLAIAFGTLALPTRNSKKELIKQIKRRYIDHDYHEYI